MVCDPGGRPARRNRQAEAFRRQEAFYTDRTWLGSSTYRSLYNLAQEILAGSVYDFNDLRGFSRQADLVALRTRFCHAARASNTLIDIGRAIHRDHGTVIHALKKPIPLAKKIAGRS